MAAMVLAPQVFRLWEGDAPGALGKRPEDVPTLTAFPAKEPNGLGVVVCPGGGYGMLADHEGTAYAKFLNRHGFSAWVLQYRLGSTGYRHPAMLQDASRAVRFVRSHAAEWGVKKVGIMGSSAGGHLASTALTHYDKGTPEAADPVERVSSRPDFGVLCYAVITMGGESHSGSRDNLLGPNPDPALVADLSNETRVTSDTPPTFLWSTSDDNVVPVENTLSFARSLARADVPFEVHIYPRGPHGLGLGGPPESDALMPWTTDLVRWLKSQA